TQGSENFYKYISKELLPYVSENITKSVFPIIIGHSDAAVFVEKIMVKNNQPFRAFLSLSPQLTKNQLNEIKAFATQKFENNLYHFVASGTSDATARLQSVKKLDSLFNH